MILRGGCALSACLTLLESAKEGDLSTEAYWLFQSICRILFGWILLCLGFLIGRTSADETIYLLARACKIGSMRKRKHVSAKQGFKIHAFLLLVHIVTAEAVGVSNQLAVVHELQGTLSPAYQSGREDSESSVSSLSCGALDYDCHEDFGEEGFTQTCRQGSSFLDLSTIGSDLIGGESCDWLCLVAPVRCRACQQFCHQFCPPCDFCRVGPISLATQAIFDGTKFQQSGVDLCSSFVRKGHPFYVDVFDLHLKPRFGVESDKHFFLLNSGDFPDDTSLMQLGVSHVSPSFPIGFASHGVLASRALVTVADVIKIHVQEHVAKPVDELKAVRTWVVMSLHEPGYMARTCVPSPIESLTLQILDIRFDILGHEVSGFAVELARVGRPFDPDRVELVGTTLSRLRMGYRAYLITCQVDIFPITRALLCSGTETVRDIYTRLGYSYFCETHACYLYREQDGLQARWGHEELVDEPHGASFILAFEGDLPCEYKETISCGWFDGVSKREWSAPLRD